MKFTLALLGATLLAFLQNVQATPSAAIMQAGLLYDGHVVVGLGQKILDMDWLMFAKLLEMMHLPSELLEHILRMVMNSDGCTKPKWGALIIRFRHLMKSSGNKLLEDISSSSSSGSPVAVSEDANTIDELKKFLDMNSVSPIEDPGLIEIINAYDWDLDGFYDVVECYALLELLLVGNRILAWSQHNEDIRHEIHRMAAIKGAITNEHLRNIFINLEIEEERIRLLGKINQNQIRAAKAFVWRWDGNGILQEKRNGTLSMDELVSALQDNIGNDELAAIKEEFGLMANPGDVQNEPEKYEVEWNEVVFFLKEYFLGNHSKFENFAKLVFVENPETLAEFIAGTSFSS